MARKSLNKIQVIELFAGVGGFREAMLMPKGRSGYDVVWSNQWEPAEARKPGEQQVANRVYIKKFSGKGGRHSARDIDAVTSAVGMPEIPRLKKGSWLLVGGFPCQDYSVAKPRNASRGMLGPKGVLWWNIRKIIEERAPGYVLLENVDLLIKSPSECRGRDFAIILKSLDDLGYAVEWRVINAGDCGYIQRRRRTYIFAYKAPKSLKQPSREMITSTGLFSKAFGLSKFSEFTPPRDFPTRDVESLKTAYRPDLDNVSPFKSAGAMARGMWISAKCEPGFCVRPKASLRAALITSTDKISSAELSVYQIRGKDTIRAWAYAKGRKDEVRRKIHPLEKYIKEQLGGGRGIRLAEIRRCARSLPQKLQMNVLVSTRRGRPPGLLTREDLNEIVRAVLSESRRMSPETIVTSKMIRSAMSAPAVARQIEASIERRLVQRSMSDMARSKIVCPSVRSVTGAIRILSGNALSRMFNVGKKAIRLSRDEAAHSSVVYRYQEGGMAFPDPLNRPSRTVITSEGGPAVSRFKHVICEVCASGRSGHGQPSDCIAAGRLRRLHPLEIERLNGFSPERSVVCDALELSPSSRIMLMGNAVIVDLLRNVFKLLPSWIKSQPAR